MPIFILLRNNTQKALMDYFETLLHIGSEYTQKLIIGLRRVGMLIITGLARTSHSAGPNNQNIWSGAKTVRGKSSL